MMNKINNITIILIIVLSNLVFSAGNKVIKHPNPNESIESKWQWAQQQSEKIENSVWIGYSIKKLMPKNSSMGNPISTDHKYYSPTLEQIIYGKNKEQFENENLTDVAKKALAHMDSSMKSSDEIVEKEIALLLHVDSNQLKNNELKSIQFANLYFYMDLKNKPVFWLGLTSQDESAKFLINKYKESYDNYIKEDFISAIGIHRESEVPLDFLISIIKSNEENNIRKKAVFWLGEHNHESSIDIIVNIVNNDKSKDVRENAVFALYFMDIEKAETALINLAKHSKDRNVKKKAIFWLGQKAADKSVDALEEIIESDNETEVKEKAVFALAQLDDNEGVPALIDIAKNHSNIEIRKKAIFWLGQSGDERALDLIISLIQNR